MIEAEIERLLRQAVADHQAGELDAAEPIYRQVLSADPDEINALNFLGVLLHQRERTEEGVGLLRRAVELLPENTTAQVNLANLLLALERSEEAEAIYRSALELEPELSTAHCNLGKALEQQGRDEEAIECFRRAVDLDAYYDDAQRSLGAALSRVGRGMEAAAHLLAWYNRDDAPEQAAEDACAAVDSAEIAGIFDALAPDYDAQAQLQRYRAPELIRTLLSTRLDQAPGSLDVLDAGCGTGLVAAALRPLASTLVGVDLSSGMLERAHERGGYDRLEETELSAFLAEQDACWDLIVAAGVLGWVHDLGPLLQACVKALRPGGLLVATIEQIPSGADAATGSDSSIMGPYQHEVTELIGELAGSGLTLSSLADAVLREHDGVSVQGWLLLAKRAD